MIVYPPASQARRQIYLGLAEAFAPNGLPEWLGWPGPEWPLAQAALQLSVVSDAARRGALALAQIPGESLAERSARYTRLFGGQSRPRFSLHESLVLSGRLAGAETAAVEGWYRAAGLEICGAELPDHASLELTFLAYLASLEEPELERSFLRQHAGKWLPELGRRLNQDGDQVFAPLGALLAGWLEESSTARLPTHVAPAPSQSSPLHMAVTCFPEKCSLCGFCARVCPAGSLAVLETALETQLVLCASTCLGCGLCEQVCEAQAIQVGGQADNFSCPDVEGLTWRVLAQSWLVNCPLCGSTIASQAEMAYIRRQIGSPQWLFFCPDCRSLEVSR